MHGRHGFFPVNYDFGRINISLTDVYIINMYWKCFNLLICLQNLTKDVNKYLTKIWRMNHVRIKKIIIS